MWVVPEGELRSIGTHPQADFRLPQLQPKHAVVRFDALFEIQPFDARTLINGLPCGSPDWRSLRPGDAIQLGPYAFRLELIGLSAETMVGFARTKRLAPQLYPPGYEVQGQLGSGGFGTVYSATRSSDGQQVALKILKYEPNTRIEKRFVRESQAAKSLDHPNIVKVIEQGLDQFPPYIAMELIEGPSADNLVSMGPVPVARALRIGLGVAEALAELDARGLVHRDVKPANVLIAKGDVAKLTDFGLVKNMDDDFITALTQSGSGMGTLCYASPEQLKDAKHVTSQADVYSLGVTLFHLIGGRPPFAISAVRDLGLVFHEPPPDLAQVRSDCPLAARDLIASMLAKAPGDRPRITDVVAALKRLCVG